MRGTSVSAATCKSRDWSRQPLGIVLWWALPIALGVSTNFLGLSVALAASIWAVAFAWMGTGCLLNALRCARLHCFISGPVLCLGAIAAAFIASGILSGRHALGDVVNVTSALALLSFLPEWAWGMYRAGSSVS
jgi:hypothetical protein